MLNYQYWSCVSSTVLFTLYINEYSSPLFENYIFKCLNASTVLSLHYRHNDINISFRRK